MVCSVHKWNDIGSFNNLICDPARKKHSYAKFDLKMLLAERGIVTSLIMPKLLSEDEQNEKIQVNVNPEEPAPFLPYLPLHIFDNTEYDCRTPQEWLNLGSSKDDGDQKPVPGVALLQDNDDITYCKLSVMFQIELIVWYISWSDLEFNRIKMGIGLFES